MTYAINTYTVITTVENHIGSIAFPAVKGLFAAEVNRIKEDTRKAANPGDTITHNVILER